MSDCIFCKIAARELPGQFLYEDDDIFVIRDLYPKAPVHLLIIPARHVGALSDGVAEEQAVLGRMVTIAGDMARQEGVAEDGYRLIVNQGPNSGQEVPHLHLHLLGGRRLGAMA